MRRSGHCTGMCRCREAQARIVPDNPFAFPPSLEVRCARATLAANIPERKAERRIRGQARSYKILSKPRSVGAAIAQGRAGVAKHRQGLFPTILLHFLHPWRSDVRERPWPRTFQSVKPNAEFAGKPAPTRFLSKPRSVGAAIAQGCAGAVKHKARIVPDNPFAFPPSLEVRCARTALAANIPERRASKYLPFR